MSVKRYVQRKVGELEEYAAKQADDAKVLVAKHVQIHGIPRTEQQLMDMVASIVYQVGTKGRPEK